MQIKLIGWTSEGFRCPDIKVDLRREGSVPQVSLIQMPNGTGKTTTLNLLKATLTGHAESWPAERVRTYQKKDSDKSHGTFVVHLFVDDSLLTLELTLDFDEGHARYRTSYQEEGGLLTGWKPPPAVHRFLSQQFVKLFVFDGEFADRLLDPQEHEAEQAIDALFQLFLFDQIQEEAERLWERAVSDKSGTSEKAKTRREKKLKDINTQLTQIRRAKKKLEQEIQTKTEALDQLSIDIQERIDQVDSLRVRRQEAQAKLNAAQEDVTRITADLVKAMRSPAALHPSFALQIRTLKGSLDTLQLPATTSRQFFQELLDEKECVCGRELDEEAKHNIRIRSERYLGAETSGFLNALKNDIDQYLESDPQALYRQVASLKATLGEAMRKRIAANGDLRSVTESLEDMGDEQIRSMEDTKERLEEELGKREDLLRNITRDPLPADDSTDIKKLMCLKALEKQQKEAKAAVAEITETVQLRARIDCLKSVLQTALTSAREDLRVSLLDDCQTRLQRILAFNPVTLDGIDGALRLKDQEGASVGQTLAVAYTFLTTLLGRGQHQFPLVVDSPANPIDNTVRTEIAKIIPQLTRQFVAFTISSERTGFVDQLHNAANGDVRYLTLFRKNEFTAPLLTELPAGAQQTVDGVLVDGRDYFNAFDTQRIAED